ncbi:non-ribosomal peptide synthetase [Chlorella sorokiniana]|uniref:Non-ribosomal peptide synthetase n=1 Tax=Chlorella sorokiniana TaxID=3076 RepID=A0A2P6TND3_CHLSO|nr:non-ribosomal peptide synthetase [Chlorella sorokiniana]|eukprot:PRW50829.1 non-ribosomal peptide synthetase [Chlorella sorokiniana]
MSSQPGSPEAGLEPAGPPAQPPAALLLPPGGACLRLGAEDAFHARLNQHRAYSTLPCLVLTIAALALLCCWSSAPPLTLAWLAAYCTGAAVTVVWLFVRPASFARWREVPAVLLGVFSTGLGLHWAQLERLIDGFHTSGPVLSADGTSSATAGQILRHAGTLLAASGAIHLAVIALSLRTRLTLFAPTWLLVAVTAWLFNSSICSTAPLSNPVAQAATAAIYKALSFLSFCMPIPVAAWAECRTLLTFFQLSIGWLAPVLFSGVREARLFQQHQLQRWRAHLPLERGFSAWLYDSL